MRALSQTIRTLCEEGLVTLTMSTSSSVSGSSFSCVRSPCSLTSSCNSGRNGEGKGGEGGRREEIERGREGKGGRREGIERGGRRREWGGREVGRQ